ncbi:hypothetical protein FQR65_LT14027 [Abscondita terminalis]|nr:hypothetical protein FQR65_LT14027 [Abscondita terminalis]
MCSMQRWVEKVAVVTGSSSGIGAAISTKLVQAGVVVVGLARRKKNLLELSEKLRNEKGKFFGFKADVSKEDDVVDAFEWIERCLGPVHILINNAGVIKTGYSLTSGNLKVWKEVMDTNVLGLCVVTKEALASMTKHNVAGHVVHINSIFGHKIGNVPLVNVYAASKHAVTALTETLRKEFINTKLPIKVSSVSPGLVQTELFKTAYETAMVKANIPLTDDALSTIKALPVLTSEDVAEAILYVLSTPPNVQVHELIVKPLFELE